MYDSIGKLIEEAKRLGDLNLQEGYIAFQNWRRDCIDYMQGLIATFAETVGTPGDIDEGVRFLKQTFIYDDPDDVDEE